ncbi:TPA: hypothetical protein KKX32_000316 [Legionella pneumophila]|uniref:Uncharacterized protein n=1 Tax=Legionella pneumophila TaxID=446 RepID=A0AAP3MDV7_LEGPN|nr:hypothetical protein [Legionella pneumophila]AMQ28368.1 hypothetical protein lpt_10435 [Legionella pneumophila subsp. pneumophila]MBN5929533.1 hypothetical protein [Legionella pneumophila]MCO1452114.1 hypothetical protein [Legionella pneumophila]MCZ4692340.1 hypothetical protein [Legionella pneumophila]MCZ4711477.1 hypothetical protein [Legionella pneumophila]
MFNKRIHKSIIGISKIILPVGLLLLLTPQMMQFSSELNLVNRFLQAHQMSFLFFHSLFYLALYWCWPKLIIMLVNRCHHELDEAQIKLAVQARGYLLTALVFFELMVLWR